MLLAWPSGAKLASDRLEALAREHSYFVVGSWDDFQQCLEMRRDESGWSLDVRQGGGSRFQFLLDRAWFWWLPKSVREATGSVRCTRRLRRRRWMRRWRGRTMVATRDTGA